MKSRTLFLSLVVFLLLSACTVPTTPVETPEITEVSSPGTGADPESTVAPVTGAFTLEWLQSLPPQTVLLQMDYEPTFSTPEVFYEFGRIPPFTLYADGTVIYLDEGQTFEDQEVMVVTLTSEETLALVQQISDFGFARLESYTDSCKDLGDGTQTCVADASFTILRAQMSTGEFREIKIFFEYANHLKAFQSITTHFVNYTHPNAQPYIPQIATLFIRPLTDAIGVQVLDWPLDPGILTFLRPGFANEGMSAFPLTMEPLEQFLAVVPHNTGSYYFTFDGQDYATLLVPWLPGVDYTTAIQQEFPAPQVEFSNPDASPTTFANCPTVENNSRGALRLAYVSAGDLWLWDQGQEPVQITTTGNISYALLTDDGRLLFYASYSANGSPELWVVNGVNGDGEPHLLTSGPGLSGGLQLLSTSFDNQWIAFTHFLASGSEELWVANVDGSDTRMILSEDNLMSIVIESNPISASPTRVSWIPNTYTLVYDALPGFTDGGYVYEQKQNWVVDALNGQKGELFPAGEGGTISFSPDGTMMLITTPTTLRAMNVEARDVHELDIPYFEFSYGEFNPHIALAWTSDSKTLLMAEPVSVFQPGDFDSPVAIWSVPVDGSASTKLGEFDGHFPSFVFSPDLTKIVYWRGIDPQSDVRELHIATLDGTENIVYDTANRLEFDGWAPDSQSFLYTIEDNSHQVMWGNLCQPAYPMMTVSGYLVSWLDADSFLYLSQDNTPSELLLGTINGAISFLTTLEGWFDFALVEK